MSPIAQNQRIMSSTKNTLTHRQKIRILCSLYCIAHICEYQIPQYTEKFSQAHNEHTHTYKYFTIKCREYGKISPSYEGPYYIALWSHVAHLKKTSTTFQLNFFLSIFNNTKTVRSNYRLNLD